MKDIELVSALRKLKVNTKGLACLGCNYGYKCSTNGCNLIGLAADRLNEVSIILSIIKGMQAAAKESEKSLLGIVLRLFDRYYGNTHGIPRNSEHEQQTGTRNDVLDALAYAPMVFSMRKYVTDFERCADTEELAATLRNIDENGYTIIGATQDGIGLYTVIFRRPARE